MTFSCKLRSCFFDLKSLTIEQRAKRRHSVPTKYMEVQNDFDRIRLSRTWRRALGTSILNCVRQVCQAPGWGPFSLARR